MSVTGTSILKSNRPTPRVHGLVSGDATGGLMPAPAGVAPGTAVSTCGAVWRGQQGTYQVTLGSYEGRPVRVNNTDPGHYLPRVHGKY
ncbi:hypothetical protein TIFTF001_036564 [Ficus carica]|uniref:Uncharacterized protein n=1 Tax=Ficus carica TaxID=3494 RepID=A0AA88E3L8_FICCA|nr:hypothetical protein TIFTF001_036564 [Ficus carica]